MVWKNSMLNFLKENWFKTVVIVMLVVATGSYPYSFYQILRWVVCATAAYDAYALYMSKRNFLLWPFVGIAVLFNPVAPIYMSRATWQVFDLLAAFIFLASFFLRKKVENQ